MTLSDDAGKREDGGAAFPHEQCNAPVTYPGRHEVGTRVIQASRGMSLRDYFAAAALTGLLASESEGGTYHKENAEMAYALADAMLRASVRPSPPAAKAEG